MKISSTVKQFQPHSLAEGSEFKDLSATLALGQSVFFPVSTEQCDALRKVLGSQVRQISSDQIIQINNITVNSVQIDPKVKAELEKNEILLGGVSVNGDMVKGAVVGGGVAGLLLSLTNTAKGLGPAIGLATSCIALGSVLYPDVAERIRKSEWQINEKGVTIKPPPQSNIT